MSVKRTVKEYFTFNKKEKRALLIFSILIILVSISPSILLLFDSDGNLDNKVFESDVKKFYAGQIDNRIENQNSTDEIIQNDFAINSKTESVISGKKIAQLFSFDPNISTENDFEKLGLEPRTIKSIVNYRNKGGSFKSPEDFKKIYTLTEEDFNRLKSFIEISETRPEKKFTEQIILTSYQPTVIDINIADSLDWVNLPGIGPYLASKILKYKIALGGFSNINQIAEVYGIKPETFESIKEKIKCDLSGNSSIKKINLNAANKDELNAHPYINFKQAMILINFREQHGPYKNIDDVKSTDCFSEPEFNKIKLYLTVN